MQPRPTDSDGFGATARHGVRDWRPRLVLLLWVAATLLVGASALTLVIARITATSAHGWFWDEIHENLSLGVEFNLPTWFASMLWGLFAVIAWYLATADHGRRVLWRMVAVVGLMGSIDEYLMLHDRLSAPGSFVENVIGIDLGGATWVLPGIVVAGLIATVLARFVLSLPATTRRDLIIGGLLFLAGAIGFEVISSLAFEATATVNWVFVVTMHIEESLEYAGVIVAIRGLLGMTSTVVSAISEQSVLEVNPEARP